ncbi:Ribokinase-like protein [Roridomyces roridus]|uniref:Adenosine kinase n=1 Tax=Roridomyces roridus TaxID=1738132 RepID=A0AAD7B2A6_9AGAR|nr:Ribokinase-like protein [Roridomyces roridus]
MPHELFCIGDPLLDMQVTNGAALLEKYDLKPDDGIRAGEKHDPIYAELVEHYNVTYVAGGAAQNSARGAAYILPQDSVVYTGAVGDDDRAEQLRVANKVEGVRDVYLVKKGERTGACAVIITGEHRSLVTTLRAAGQFEKSHLESELVAPFVEKAKVFYVEGYFLTHGVESILYLGKKVSAASKILALNISAPYLPQLYGAQLAQVIPYMDIIICNTAEAISWARANGLPDTTPIPIIAKTLSLLPKSNPTHPRLVLVTQGSSPAVLVSSAAPDSPRTYPAHAVPAGLIVDTNGAGDAFAGGFLGAYVAGRDLDEAVEAGHRLASMSIQQVGPQYQWPKVSVI